MFKLYLTTKQLAQELQISVKSLERKRRNGSGPQFIKTGHKVLYARLDLEKWLASNVHISTSEYRK